jgi:serine/threonine-protein kinase RsbW
MTVVEGGAGPQWVPESGAAVLPLPARGRGLGALAFGGRLAGREIEGHDLPFLAEIAERAGLALENARLYEQERTVALTLQESLLAGEPPSDPRCSIATHYQPGVGTLEVGGDFFDSFWVRDGVLGLAVGDVVGRGLSAASGMGQLRSGLRALAGTGLGPAGVLEQLDRFADGVVSARAATVVYVEVDLADGTARYTCAGHPPPLLAPHDGAPVFLEDGRSIPLGLFGMPPRRADGHLTLRPGDQLLLYTDGLVETRTASIDDGLERLRAAVARGIGPAELAAEMVGGAADDDDVCLLCFELRAPA